MSESALLKASLRILWILCLLGLGFGLLLLFAVPTAILQGAPAKVTLYLFRTHDTLWLALSTVAIPVLAYGLGRRSLGSDRLIGMLETCKRPVTLMFLAVLTIGALGVPLVYHGYALSLDEFLARFQAETISGGHLLAPLDADWAQMAPALQPLFMSYDLANGFWTPGYRPVSAALIALFELVHLGQFTAVVLAAACLPLLAGLARRLWPAEAAAPALAVFLLAASPQFLVTAMTPYAMTAHLFFSLLWLRCHLRGGRIGHAGAALTGFFAVGLHQLHVHPFFILPFMVSLLPQRRFRLALFYALWYAAVLWFWISWQKLAATILYGAGGESELPAVAFLMEQIALTLSYHSLVDVSHWLANLFRFLSWQNLLLVPLLYIAFRHWRGAPWLVRMLGWSVFVSLVPYLLFMPWHGHGWGYRYLHPLLGNLALLAVYGWLCLKASLRGRALPATKRLLVGLAVAGLVFGLPLRLHQVERFVAPFAAASAYIAALDEDVVLVDGTDTWFAVDLVRNDPFLRQRPKVLEANSLTDRQLRRLCAGYRPRLIDHETFRHFAMTRMPRTAEARRAARRALEDRLVKSGCARS